jgi:hypothetical protein
MEIKRQPRRVLLRYILARIISIRAPWAAADDLAERFISLAGLT